MTHKQTSRTETPLGTIETCTPGSPPDRRNSMTEDVENKIEGAVEAPAKKPVVILNRDDEDLGLDDPATQEMLAMIEESLKTLDEGEIVRGKVLRLDDTEVLVDIGGKSEGVISMAEFSDADAIKVGDTIDVFLEKMENQDGLIELSKTRADFVKVWDKVKDAYDQNEVVEGRLLRKIKGGVVVDLFGVEAFLPGSQIALRQVQ